MGGIGIALTFFGLLFMKIAMVLEAQKYGKYFDLKDIDGSEYGWQWSDTWCLVWIVGLVLIIASLATRVFVMMP